MNKTKLNKPQITTASKQTQQYIKNLYRTATVHNIQNAVESEHVQCYISNGRLVLL